MTKLGKKSKRQSTKHRVKVEKKVREHNRKLRKEAKKNPKKGSKKKDPGVPNILPFRDEVIKEAQAYNAKKEEEREKKKAARKKARERLQNKNRNMGDIVKQAQTQQAAYDRKNNDVVTTETSSSTNKFTENSRKAFYKEFKKVIDAADIILEVLDARDPLGSRSLEVEEAVRSAAGNKRLVLVLNKIDLVPKENVEAWLRHLRKELPAVAFKASTQQQRDHLTQSKVDYYKATTDLLKSSHCLGADVLMKLLRNYCRNTEMAINVGVVGFPNTGKSSIINSLKRAKACEVGANPGITKAMQSVQLDKHIKLLDSPGVVLTNSPSDVAAVLRNVVKLESLDDPVPCVEAILMRCQKMQMMLHYNLTDYTDTLSFLNLLARRMGKLRKGGVPDINQAARALLQDWNSGKITYYTAPPEDKPESAHHLGAKIVSDWSKEFNLDDLLNDEQLMMNDVERKHTSPMLVTSVGPLKAVTSENDLEENTPDQAMGDGNEDDDDDESAEEEDMEDDDEPDEELKGVTVKTNAMSKKGKTAPMGKKQPARKRGPQPKVPLERFGGLLTKKGKKMAAKKDKKKKKRADNLAGKLSNAMTTAFSGL